MVEGWKGRSGVVECHGERDRPGDVAGGALGAGVQTALLRNETWGESRNPGGVCPKQRCSVRPIQIFVLSSKISSCEHCLRAGSLQLHGALKSSDGSREMFPNFHISSFLPFPLNQQEELAQITDAAAARGIRDLQ